MSGAIEAVQIALVTALRGHGPLMSELSGIFDGPPPRARFPYIAMATGAAIDWGYKGGVGRELRLAFSIHDDGQGAARLHRLMGLAEDALSGGLPVPGGWQIVTFDFMRSRVARDVLAPWNGLIEYRANVIKTDI